MASQEKTSPWVYVAIGCLSVLVMGAVAVGVLVFVVYRWGKNLEATFKDPATRLEKVKEVLGCEELPEGYHPMGAFSVPFLMELALLSDRQPDEKGEVEGFDERGFIYVKMIRLGQEQQELRDFFEGKTDDPKILRRNKINIDVDEILKRGVLEGEGQSLLYVAQRGDLEVESSKVEGLTTLILVECPEDEKLRLGIWFGPDPSGGKSRSPADLAGSPADESAIRDFMAHFRLCGARGGTAPPARPPQSVP